MNIETKLNACRNTREIAARSFQSALTGLLVPGSSISEVDLRDAWLNEMRKNNDLLPDGWYDPPPHGIGVLFSTEADPKRANYDSLRTLENWPQNNITLDRETGIMYVYASPVDRQTGIIGDFGMTIYLGQSSGYINHLKNCMRMNLEIFNQVAVGMTMKEVAQLAGGLFIANNLTNNVTSVTDPAGVNIGHTVPASYEDWTVDEIKAIQSMPDKWQKTISSKRVFVSGKESFEINPGTAFTLEPRLTVYQNTKTPMSSFHTIIVFNPDGSKELLTNFSEIFTGIGMDYMNEVV